MKLFAPHVIDLYKPNHVTQYPEGTESVYSNFTARDDKYAQWLPDFDHKKVVLGLQLVIKDLLIDMWNDTFFSQPKAAVLAKYKRRMDGTLGPGAIPVDKLAALHDLGYLPLRIKALSEGVRVNIRVPELTVVNTHAAFGWLTNYIETQFSSDYWKIGTNATIAYEYWRLLTKYARMTGSPLDFVQWQAHDFSARGLSGKEDAARNIGHLACFRGSDTVHAMDAVEDYYGEVPWLAGSVPASEHSVVCMGGMENERETLLRLITQVCPSGVFSFVSDTWDFWKLLTVTLPSIKSEILARTPDANGLAKLVIRPDSGDPVKIICGDPATPFNSPAYKGALQCLWEVFGGTETPQGYKVLHPRIGLIYGDSITLDRASKILERMALSKFASCNVVLGVGSYTYNMSTRDTFGHAYKATWGQIKGSGVELHKDPITDSGLKKSLKGLIRVEKEGDSYVAYDQQTPEQEKQGELRTIFENGKLLIEEDWSTIRKRLGCIMD